jgi:hypothetical protein
MNTVLMNNPELTNLFMDNVPLNRWGKPEEIREAGAVFVFGRCRSTSPAPTF